MGSATNEVLFKKIVFEDLFSVPLRFFLFLLYLKQSIWDY